MLQSGNTVNLCMQTVVYVWNYYRKMHPVLLYGLEVCPLTKAGLHSLDFAVTRFLMKLLKTSSIRHMI